MFEDAPGSASSPAETTAAVLVAPPEPAAQSVTPQASATTINITKREWLRDLRTVIGDKDQTLCQQLNDVEQQLEELKEKGATIHVFYNAQKAFRQVAFAIVDG
jgi:hypothetical protein